MNLGPRSFASRLVVGFAAGIALGLASSPNGPVRACSCLPPPPPAEALFEADVVFRGTVTQLQRVPDNRAPLPGFRTIEATLTVATTWKGEAATERKVYTSGDSASCGYPFRLGDDVIVYGDLDTDTPEPRGLLSTYLCSRTRAFAPGEAAALDAAIPSPTPGAEPTPGPSPTAPAPTPAPTRPPCPACPAPMPDQAAVARYDAVFHGQVRSATALGAADDWAYRVRFDVVDVWKGDVHAVETVTVLAVAWFCGQGFERLGESWLVFALDELESQNARFRIDICSPTMGFSPDIASQMGPSCAPPRVELSAERTQLSVGETTFVELAHFDMAPMTVTLIADPPGIVEVGACFVPEDERQCRRLPVRALAEGAVTIDVLALGDRCRCVDGRCGQDAGSASAPNPLRLDIFGANGPGTATSAPPATATRPPGTPEPTAEPFTVRGRVLDAVTRRNVEGATAIVTVLPGTCEGPMVTLRDGFFSRNCQTTLPASLEITIAADNYEDWSRRFAIPVGGRWDRMLEVSLTPLDRGDGPIYLPLTMRDAR